jgi:lipoyl-dependent peroxiredoxin
MRTRELPGDFRVYRSNGCANLPSQAYNSGQFHIQSTLESEERMAVRTSSAEWKGTLKEGAGTMKLGSGAYEGPFTYASRFETGHGTNPEELLGAAHAGCFSMFLAALLTSAGFAPARISTTATVHLGEGPAITLIELNTQAEVPNLTEADLQKHAEAAKRNCPVSKALAGPEIKLRAQLVK